MEFLPKVIDEYVELHSEPESEVLAELSRETWQKVMIPRMLSGHLQGRILSLFSNLIAPKRILEIGTYTGYSAICLAEGLQDGGELITLELNEELSSIQDKYWGKSNNLDRIKRMIGPALESIDKLEGPFDLVFIDADKENYLNYYEKAIEMIRPNGLILIDNVLWSGKVVEEAESNDKETQILQQLNEVVNNDARVQNVLMPVRDGLMAVRKK
jgi:caffeoyl-CoA O-methyltransferase